MSQILTIFLFGALMAVIARALVPGAFRDRRPTDAEQERNRSPLVSTFSESLGDSAILQDALEERGHVDIRAYCAVFKSKRDDIVPPRFLMVSADVLESDLSFERLAEITRVIVTICVEKSLTAGLVGVEILLRMDRPGRSNRIARISTLTSGLGFAAGMTAAHFARPDPFPGVQCQVYRANLRD